MKSSAFADRLDDLAATFSSARATSVANALTAIIPVFRVLPTKTVADVVKKLADHDFPSASFMQTRLDTITDASQSLERFVSSVATKSVAADFKALAELLEKHRNASLDQFVATATQILTSQAAGKTKSKATKVLRADLIEHYNKMLEEALGDDPGFRRIIADLQKDPDMASAEMTALAKRFAFASAKGKEQALKKITSRHQDLMISRAASRATAGRIAG